MNNYSKPCEILASELGSLFECRQISDDLVRIRTPFTYPDGDIVDLFVEDDGSRITDLGETLRWLRMQTATRTRTIKQQSIIESVCSCNGLELSLGQIRTKTGDLTSRTLASSVVSLAQGCVRVSDVWFTYRHRNIVSVADEVAEYLDENDVGYERNKRIEGHSGREVTLDFLVPKSNSLVQVLASSSSATTLRVVDHAVRVWKDLEGRGYNFVTLVDDSSDVWNKGEIDWFHEMSSVANWSQPKDLLQYLATSV